MTTEQWQELWKLFPPRVDYRPLPTYPTAMHGDELATNNLACAIHSLTKAIEGRAEFNLVLKRIEQLEEKIMSQLTDRLDKIQGDLDTIGGAVEGIAAGVLNLDKIITDFQNSPGTLSPSDQAALDKAQAASAALVTKVKAITTEAPGAPSQPPNPNA